MNRCKRSGSVLPLALLLVFLVVAMGGMIVSTLVLSKRYNRNASDRIQSEYIFNAAYQRAIRQFQETGKLKDEVWHIPLEISDNRPHQPLEETEIWRTVRTTIIEPDLQSKSKNMRIQMEILTPSALETADERQGNVWTQTRQLILETERAD